MNDYRSDYDILKETGLTNREIVKMRRNIDYMIYEMIDFKVHFLEYMRDLDCDVEEVLMFAELVIDGKNNFQHWYRVDFPDGESYLVQFML